MFFLSIVDKEANNQLDVLSLLLDRGLHPNDVIRGVARLGHQGIVDELLNRGGSPIQAVVGAVEGEQEPLFWYIINRYEEGVRRERVESLKQDAYKLLFYGRRNLDWIDRIIQSGIDPAFIQDLIQRS